MTSPEPTRDNYHRSVDLDAADQPQSAEPTPPNPRCRKSGSRTTDNSEFETPPVALGGQQPAGMLADEPYSQASPQEAIAGTTTRLPTSAVATAGLADELARSVLVQHGLVEEGGAGLAALTRQLRSALCPEDAIDEILLGLLAGDIWRLSRLLRCEAVGVGARVLESLKRSREGQERAAEDERRQRREQILEIRACLEQAQRIATGEERPWSGYVRDASALDQMREDLQRLEAIERQAVRESRARREPLPDRSVETLQATIAELEAVTLDSLPACASAHDFALRRRSRYVRRLDPQTYIESLPRNCRGLLRQEALREARRGLDAAQAEERQQRAVERRLAEAAIPDAAIERREAKLRAGLTQVLEMVLRRHNGTPGNVGSVEVRAHRRSPRGSRSR